MSLTLPYLTLRGPIEIGGAKGGLLPNPIPAVIPRQELPVGGGLGGDKPAAAGPA